MFPARSVLTPTLWVLGAALLSFAKLAEDVSSEDPLVRTDAHLAGWLHTHSSPAATSLADAVTALGATRVLTVSAVAAVGFLAARRRYREMALVAVGFFGAEGLNLLLKSLFERQRPSFSDPIATASGFSFPSGHAMTSLVLYGTLAVVALPYLSTRRARIAVICATVGLVAAIGASRIYLGVHYLSDVLAAYAAGLAWLLICLLIVGMPRRGAQASHAAASARAGAAGLTALARQPARKPTDRKPALLAGAFERSHFRRADRLRRA